MAEVHPTPTNPRFKDLTGQIFGRLTVKSYGGTIPHHPGYDHVWNCTCSCDGKELVVRGFSLTGKKSSRSCGCVRAEKFAVMNTTHGNYVGGDNPEFSIYRLMIDRCYDSSCKSYKNYGNRGITVCERWKGESGFANFFADMGPRGDVSLSLERKDNDKGYEPGNCIWATRTAQARNTRNNRLITLNGETLCMSEWAERIGLRAQALWMRLDRGWPLADALTTPKAKRFQ